MRLGKFLAALLLLCPIAAHATACPTGYSYAKAFVVPSQNVGSTLTNFPVLLAFNGLTPTDTGGLTTPTSFVLADMKASGSGGKIQSSGNDVVFCDAASGGNLLNFERVQYSGTTGTAEYWVQRTLSSSSDTAIWMFYGKASDTDHSSAAATWASYGLVIHAPDGSSLALADATGTNTVTNHGSTAASGQIGGAMNVSATGPKYASVASDASLQPTTGMSWGAWIYPTANVSIGMILSKNDGTDTTGYDLYLGKGGSSTEPVCQVANSGDSGMRALASLSLNTWHYVMCTTNSTPNTGMKQYVDGVQVTSFQGSFTSATALSTNTTALSIGRRTSGTVFAGEARVDEIRITSAVLSADWIAAEYLNHLNPTGFAIMRDANAPASMSSGAYCVPLTIDHTQVPNTDQTNFPLLVNGRYAWMADTSNGGFAVAGNSGHDIRFYADSGCSTTALNFQRVYWKNTTGEGAFRVRVPTVSHTTDTTIYVRIGSTSDTAEASALWMGSYGYPGVFAGGAPGTVDTLDSGSGGVTLSCGTSAFSTSSPIGGGWYFANVQNDNATCGWTPTTAGDGVGVRGYPSGSQAGHIRMWARTVPATAAGGVFNDVEFAAYGKANGSGQRGIQIEYRTNQLTGMQTLQQNTPGPGIMATNYSSSGSTPTFAMDYNWHVYDFDQPTNGATFSQTALYIDGTLVAPIYVGATGSSVLATDNTVCCTNMAEVRLGRMAAHGVGWMTGFVTGFEVSSNSMSADTVKARYNNEISPGAFYSFGTAAAYTGGGGGGGSQQPVVNVVM